MSNDPRRLLKSVDVGPKQSLGQNFCVDPNILAKICAGANIGPDDQVVEIGAGTGALTDYLVRTGATVYAIELDQRMVPMLEDQFGVAPNFNLHHGSALDTLEEILAGLPEKAIVVGNLPYHISSQIIFHLMDCAARIKRAVITLQLEMADRLAAKVCTKDYGGITVRLKAYAEVKRLFKISPNCFHPAPKVFSACVLLDFERPDSLKPMSMDIFAEVVKASFARRRKQLINSLTTRFEKSLVQKALNESGIDPKRRAESLDYMEFVSLADMVGKIK